MAEEPTIDVQKLLRFLYQCPVGVAEVDASGRIKMLNAVGTQLLMVLTRDGRLTDLFDLLGVAGQQLRRDVQAFERDEGEVCRERRLTIERPRAPDEPLHLSMTLIRLGADTLMAAFTDVSTQVQQEQQIREALEAQAFAQGKMQMASMVLHDTGNAVTGIGTRVAQLLADVQWPERVQLGRLRQLAERKRDDFDRVLGSGKGQALAGLVTAVDDALAQRAARWKESMTSLSRSVAHIQELLNIQRAYAGRSGGNGGGRRERVVLAAIVDDALAIHRGALTQRSITVERAGLGDVPLLEGDRTQLVRVVLNLLKNATDAFDAAGERAERRVAIAAHVQDGRVHLRFEDNATGFSPERAEALFEVGVSTRAHSSGLGLAGARRTVEEHGGRLWLASEGPGRGACAHLELPTPRDPP